MKYLFVLFFSLNLFAAPSYVVHSVSAEVDKLYGTGGLKLAVLDKAKYIQKLGHEIKLIMPYYTVLDDLELTNIQVLSSDLSVIMNHGQSIFTYDVVQFDHPTEPQLKVIAIKHKPGEGYANIFNNKTNNGTKVYSLHPNEGEVFGFFSKAYTHWMDKISLKSQPDYVILNDWHTGFTSALLKERKEKYLAKLANNTSPAMSKKVPYIQFVVHNLKYQGIFDPNVFGWIGLDLNLFHSTEMNNMTNFLKTGFIHSDEIEAVSGNYAKEITTSRFAEGLESITAQAVNEGRLTGQLNGIDPSKWNPQTPNTGNPQLDQLGFSTDDLSNKKKGRDFLIKKIFNINPSADTVLIALTARLDQQKGFDFLVGDNGVFEKVLSDTSIDIKFVIAGDPHGEVDKSLYVQEIRKLEQKYPQQIRLFSFSDELERSFLYFSDFYLGASIFEPSGLAQMFAQSVGTPPIVSRVGGHVDSVAEGKTGFLFDLNFQHNQLNHAQTADNTYKKIKEAALAHQDEDTFSNIVKSTMNKNNSWGNRVTSFQNFMELAAIGFFDHEYNQRTNYVHQKIIDVNKAAKSIRAGGGLCSIPLISAPGLRF